MTTDTAVKGGRLATQAGILCELEVFCLYLDARLRWETGMTLEALPNGTATPIDAAEFVRARCGIRSRAELDHSPEAAAMFQRIVADFGRWKIREGL